MPEVASLHERALAIQTAPGARAEADAIMALRGWIDSHGMTYRIEARRASNDQPVESASTLIEPIRTYVEIFRGRESLYRFEFTPKDNRNLALLGS